MFYTVLDVRSGWLPVNETICSVYIDLQKQIKTASAELIA